MPRRRGWAAMYARSSFGTFHVRSIGQCMERIRCGPETTCEQPRTRATSIASQGRHRLDPTVLAGHSIGARGGADVRGSLSGRGSGNGSQRPLEVDTEWQFHRPIRPAKTSTPFGAAPGMSLERKERDAVARGVAGSSSRRQRLALHRWAASQSDESSIPLFNRCIDQLEKSKANRPGALGDRPLVVIGNMTLAGSEDY